MAFIGEFIQICVRQRRSDSLGVLGGRTIVEVASDDHYRNIASNRRILGCVGKMRLPFSAIIHLVAAKDRIDYRIY